MKRFIILNLSILVFMQCYSFAIMVQPTLDELTKKSLYIFVGNVDSISDDYIHYIDDKPFFLNDVNVSIKNNIKADIEKTNITISVDPIDEHQPTLKKGNIYVFFVIEKGGKYYLSWGHASANRVEGDMVFTSTIKNQEKTQKLENYIGSIRNIVKHQSGSKTDC